MIPIKISRPVSVSAILAALLTMALLPTTTWAEEKAEAPELECQLMEDGTADLGKYQIKIFDPVLRKTLHVNFELLGAVNFEDQDKFLEYMKGRYQQLRELVDTSIRTCTPEQLTDATHHTLNRKITSRINRAFGWKFLDSVEPINYRLIQWSVDEGMVPVPLRPLPPKINE